MAARIYFGCQHTHHAPTSKSCHSQFSYIALGVRHGWRSGSSPALLIAWALLSLLPREKAARSMLRMLRCRTRVQQTGHRIHRWHCSSSTVWSFASAFLPVRTLRFWLLQRRILDLASSDGGLEIQLGRALAHRRPRVRSQAAFPRSNSRDHSPLSS